MNIPIIGSKKGFFIAFEGVDGSGKTHHVDLLRQALQKTGFWVSTFRSPGSTQLGEHIRTITKDSSIKVCQEAELLLMNSDRSQLVREKIKPAMEDGQICICDRYFYSTIIYQGFGRQIDMNIVKAVTQYAVGDTVPDITFLLYIDAEEERKRKANRGTTDRFESEKGEYQKRVREGFEWLKTKEKESNGKLVVINTDAPVELVHNEIYRCVAHKVSELKPGVLKIENTIRL